VKDSSKQRTERVWWVEVNTKPLLELTSVSRVSYSGRSFLTLTAYFLCCYTVNVAATPRNCLHLLPRVNQFCTTMIPSPAVSLMWLASKEAVRIAACLERQRNCAAAFGDCPSGGRDCVGRRYLRRFSFQPLKENPLLGPSSAT
jgi:hypothetical protein